MSPKSEEFTKANAKSPVVSGYAHGPKKWGGVYTLKNGKVFDLSMEECREISPRWEYS